MADVTAFPVVTYQSQVAQDNNFSNYGDGLFETGIQTKSSHVFRHTHVFRQSVISTISSKFMRTRSYSHIFFFVGVL